MQMYGHIYDRQTDRQTDRLYSAALQVVNEDTQYVSHFLRVPYSDYPTKFAAAASRKSSVEVSQIRHVTIT